MPNYLISIEGNIGSGKSTIMEYFKKHTNFIFIDEPVKEWTTIKDSSGKNCLELFYEDQEKNSFWFQILAYITRLRNVLETLKKNKDSIIISERSIYTDHYVFARMLYDSKFLSEIEWKTYRYWFDTFVEDTKLNTIIYINTNPEICFERINKRNRKEEENKIPIDYLKKCHNKHELWLANSNVPVIEMDGNKNIEDIYLEIDLLIIKLNLMNKLNSNDKSIQFNSNDKSIEFI